MPPDNQYSFSVPASNPNGLLTEPQFAQWRQRYLPRPVSGGEELLFDGVYRAYPRNEYSYDSYLRFYPDGTVLNASVSRPNTLEEIARWFGKEHELARGTYHQAGSQIAFQTRWVAVVDHVGIIVQSRAIYLESYSHATGHWDLCWFNYLPVSNLVN